MTTTMMILGLVAAALATAVEACNCNTGAGNSWVEGRACGSLTVDDGVFHVFEDGTKKCNMEPHDARNRCPDYAPVEEELTDEIHFGFVWCDCMDEHQRIIKAATREECLRTEGLSDEQDMAYQAAGLDTRNYICECCACRSQIRGVPKVGERAKTCDAGGTNTEDPGADCAITAYWAFAFAVLALCIVGVYWKLHKRHVESMNNKNRKGGDDDSG